MSDNIKNIIRGYKLIHRLDSQFLPISIVSSIVKGFSGLLNLYLSVRVLDTLFDMQDMNLLVTLVVTILFYNLAISGIDSLLESKLTTIHELLNCKFRQLINNQCCSMDFAYLENQEITGIIHSIHNAMDTYGSGMTRLIWSFRRFLSSLISITVSMAMVAEMFFYPTMPGNFYSSRWASAALVGLFVLSIFLTSRVNLHYGKMANNAFNNLPETNNLEEYYRKYVTFTQAAKDIRLYYQEPLVQEIYLNSFRKPAFIKMDSVINSRRRGFASIFSMINASMIYLFVGLRALIGIYSVGKVLQYSGAINSLVNNIVQLTNEIILYKRNAEYLIRFFTFLDLPNRMESGTMKIRKEDSYTIEFVDVSFKYPNSDIYVLRNISFSISDKTHYAIVGMNGSGKTTAIKLMCRLYDPTEGSILLNGTNIKEFDLNEYWTIFSVLFQDFSLFSMSIRSNISLSSYISQDGLERAVRQAGFQSILDQQKDGLDTLLFQHYDENGIQLSGGESQKLAIARAIYKNAPFIFMDEPTSALDPVAEYEMYMNMDKLLENTAAVFVSHRLSSCRFCDSIIVFHEGQIVQTGTHNQLIEKDGIYKILWNAQATHYI